MWCFLFFIFFFSSRRRHTRCALVTGVQTCALPIWRRSSIGPHPGHPAHGWPGRRLVEVETNAIAGLETSCDRRIEEPEGHSHRRPAKGGDRLVRSEERRVGKECVSTCRSWGSAYH